MFNDYKQQQLQAKVVNNQDPLGAKRIQIQIEGVIESDSLEDLPWASPARNFGQGGMPEVGQFSVPAVGSRVWVRYEGGTQDGNHITYGACVDDARTKITVFQQNYPFRIGQRDLYGNHWYSDTKTGDVEFFHKSGTKIHIQPDGNVIIHVQGNVEKTVTGDVTETIQGNYTQKVSGTVKQESGGTFDIQAGGNMSVNAPRIDMN